MKLAIWLTLVSVGLCGATCCSSEAHSQTHLRQESRVFFHINLRGQLEAGSMVIAPLVRELQEAKFLASETVRRELELLDEQQKELDEVLDPFARNVFALKTEIAERRVRGVDESALRERIKLLQTETIRQVKEVLLPFQYRRLTQILFRCQLRTHGLKHMLARGPLGKELGLRVNQRDRLTTVAHQLGHQLNRDSLQHRPVTCRSV